MNFIQNGGPIMWPLLILSIVSLATVLERILFAIRFNLAQDKVRRHQFTTLLKAGNIQEAIKLSEHSSDPLLKTARLSETSSRKLFQISYMDEARNLLAKISRGSSLLDTSITMAPLLGLLGTVMGLIDAFAAIGEQGVSSPTIVTGGIAEALLATAFGLGVAIFCLIPFNIINNKEEQTREELEEIGTALESLIGNEQ